MVIPILAVVMMMFAVIPVSYAEISVTQENLTAQEQKVLDDIEQAKADGTYTQPPEAQLTATIQKYYEDVLFKIPFPVGEKYCGDVIFKMGIPEINCVAVGKAPTDQTWDEQTNTWIPDSVIAQEVKKQEAIKEAEALTDDQKQIIAIQNTLDDLFKIANPTIDEQKQTDVLLEMNYCTLRGIEDAQATQTPGRFMLPAKAIEFIDGRYVIHMPQIGLGETHSFKDGSSYAKTSLLVQECRAQIEYNGIVTPDHYRNMVMGEDDFQPRHQDKAKLDKAIDAFGTDFTDSKDGDLVQEADRAWSAQCLSNKVTDKYKKDIGCPSPYIGLYDPVREPSGFTLETASPMIQHEKHGIVCGLIPNGHIVNDRHWDYLKSFQTVPANCGNWDRITAIMLFDPMKDQGELIDQVVLAWEEAQK